MAEKGSLNQEAYQHLEDDSILEIEEAMKEEFQEAFDLYREGDPDKAKLINRLSKDLNGINKEKKKRGLLDNDEDELEAEKKEYEEWESHNVPEKIGERQVEATNRRMEVTDPEGKVRKHNFRNFDSLWAEAQRDNERFDREKGRAKEKDVLSAHKEAFKEGQVEKNYNSFGEMYEEAHEHNKKIDLVKSSNEYKVQELFKDTYERIDEALKQHLDKVKEYEEGGWLKKINPNARTNYSINKHWVERVEGLRDSLTTEQTNYFEKKAECKERLGFFDPEKVEEFSKMSERGSENDKTREEYDSIMTEMSIMEEKHKDAIEVIENFLENAGIEFEYPKDDISELSDADKTALSTEEHIFKKDEQAKIEKDPDLLARMDGMEKKLMENVKFKSGLSFRDFFTAKSELKVNERNTKENDELAESVKNEIVRYKERILTTRIKVLRLTEMIQREKKKNPEEMNFALINEASQKIKMESVSLKRYAEELKKKTIMVNIKDKVSSLMNRTGII